MYNLHIYNPYNRTLKLGKLWQITRESLIQGYLDKRRVTRRIGLNKIPIYSTHWGEATGKLITRSTVVLILRKARRHAGIWDWGGHEIRGLIPTRISEEKANAILANLKRNREKSFGRNTCH